MTRRIDGLLSEWAEDIVLNAHKSGFSGINVVEKILRDPGISTGGSRHKVHWWPRNKRIAKMSRAMHQIDSVSQVCLIVKYGRIVNDDGSIFDEKQLVRNSSIGMNDFLRLVGRARFRLNQLVCASKN